MLKLVLKYSNQIKPDVKCFCTNVSQQKINSFRTPISRPEEHTTSNIGHFYTVQPETRNQLYTYGGIPKTYHIQTQTFTETCLMVRKPAVEIINCIKSADYNKPPVAFVLYGKKGSGKSLTLAHILHYGFETGHLLVHVPWVGNWMRSCKETSASEKREGFYDINLDAAAWLVHFKHQNSHLLKDDLIIGQDYEWSKREITNKGAPLSELIDHGINRVKFASETIVALAKEIKRLSIENKCKTLVAIDGFNAFFYPKSRVFKEMKQVVHPFNVTVTEAFLDLSRKDWINAVCVVTVDEIAIAAEDHKSHLPRFLLGKQGFEHLDPFIPVKVDDYNSKEFKSCMDYYRERKWVKPLPGQDDELEFLSASNPYTLMKLCGPL